ncbi:hypothetical protein [Arthrobacter livingstonensis]|uniref:hypothetical protein n=1 Tax=Arthrobacter livingstonensis TaxID=670078 RepID=UPI00147463AB|nr:hypothetical protein [Arthrobacter livingstonensis]
MPFLAGAVPALPMVKDDGDNVLSVFVPHARVIFNIVNTCPAGSASIVTGGTA